MKSGNRIELFYLDVRRGSQKVSITLQQAQEHLDAWLAADLALSKGMSYTINTGGGTRTLERSNAAEVAERIQYWSTQVDILKNATPRQMASSATFSSG